MNAVTKEAHPGDDPRFTSLDTTLKRWQFQQDALIEVLHKAQELFGYLGRDVLLYVARALKLPPSRVYGVATFYHLFTLKPPGEHTCVVCMGTACYVNGAGALLAAAEREVGAKAGATTPDGKVSLATARCLGASSLAPVVVMDGRVRGHAEPTALVRELKGWRADGTGGPA
jgi:bidirectional [NiFe] hydrogenase diaphorase subunit